MPMIQIAGEMVGRPKGEVVTCEVSEPPQSDALVMIMPANFDPRYGYDVYTQAPHETHLRKIGWVPAAEA